MSLARRLREPVEVPCTVMAHVPLCGGVMTVYADLTAMAPAHRQAFMSGWEAWAATRGLGVRFAGPLLVKRVW